jgi:RNA polymerase-binding transcription factor DksA
MSKKTTAKAKSIVKSKAKSKPAAKKATKKTAKPAAKKAVRKAIHKSKPKPAAKPVSKAKSKLKTAPKATKSKPVVKSKPAASKAIAKAPAKKELKVSKKEKENLKAPSSNTRPAEAKEDTSQNKPVNKPSVGRPLPVNRRPEPARAIISNSKPEKESGKNRYSDSELEEFRDIINKKLEDARKELALLQAQMTAANEHGTDDTASTFKILEDGSDSLAKEEAGQLASRQKKFIEQLENALVRIENKTYGICRVTGKLIPKERLRAVPHTTQSIEAKLNQYRD